MMKQPDYIFIVGLPRTGTTLTRNILNRSKDVGLGGESHFFVNDRRLLWFRIRKSFRQKLSEAGDISTNQGAAKAVDYIYSIQKNNFWGKITKKIDQTEFLDMLLASDRSDRSLLDLALVVHAGGKPIRGDKTPAHIYSVPTLLDWFPNAKIVHTIRDPRAIYVSLVKKYENRNLPQSRALFRRLGLIFQFYSSSHTIATWLRVIRLHHRYQRRYPGQYRCFKYEDLISDPRGSLQDLCRFLEIDFTDDMLDQTSTNSSFVPRNQMQGFDAQAVDRWRRHINPLIYKWFLLWCKKSFLEFGYQI